LAHHQGFGLAHLKKRRDGKVTEELSGVAGEFKDRES